MFLPGVGWVFRFAVNPIIAFLTPILFPGKDPMIGLVLYVPVGLMLGVLFGAISAIGLSLWRVRAESRNSTAEPLNPGP